MKNWKYINGAEGVKVGNFTPNYRYKDFLITNPEGYEYIVFLKDGRTVAYRGTTSKAQAEDWCDWHDAKTGKPTGNSKTGNDTPEEYAKHPPKIVGGNSKCGNKKIHFIDNKDSKIEYVYDEETETGYIYYDGKLADTKSRVGKGWVEAIKQKAKLIGTGNSLPEELEKDVHKKDKEKVEDIEELKKTGNAKEWDVKDSDVIEYIYGDPNATKLQRICEKNLGTYDTSKIQALLVDEKSNKWAVVKRGTSAKMKTGNAFDFETSVEKGKLGLWNWYVHKDGTIVAGGTSATEANAKEMARKALEKEKVGNSTWIEPRRMPFQPKSLQYAYEQAKKKGLSGQNLENEILRIAKTTPHDSAATEDQMRKDVSEWLLRNNKVGNYSKGEVIYQQGSLKYIYGGETNGTHIVYEQPKGMAHTFSSEDEIKSWLRLGNKVGNRMSGNAGFDLRDPDPQGFLEAKARAAAQKRQREEEEKKKRIDGIYKDKDGNKWRVHYRIGPDVRSDTQYHIVRADYSDIAKLRDRIPDGFVKIGNSEDDKFAYVMREFDEGKLKTPDGKVVTDPAQAKAIAYSESKKTENGLERARNAMAKNKNVGNSTRVVDQETIGGIRTYVFYDDSDDVYYVSDKGQGPLGNIFDNPSFKTKDEAKRYIKQRIS